MSSRILLVMSGLVVVMAGCASCESEKHVSLPRYERLSQREADLTITYRPARYTGRCTSAFFGKVLKRWTLIEGECDMVRVTHSSMLFPMSGTYLVSYDDAFLLDPASKKCQEGDWVQIRLVRALDPLPEPMVDEHTLIVVGEK